MIQQRDPQMQNTSPKSMAIGIKLKHFHATSCITYIRVTRAKNARNGGFSSTPGFQIKLLVSV